MSYHSFAMIIGDINHKIGRFSAWLVLIMVVMMASNVALRYAFDASMIWQSEAVLFAHAILIMAMAGYTLSQNEHVRVDVIYHCLSPRYQALTDMIGAIIFLIPMAVVIAYTSSDFIISSWKIHEASSEYAGLPGIFIIKTSLWVFCGTLILQAMVQIMKSFQIVSGKKH